MGPLGPLSQSPTLATGQPIVAWYVKYYAYDRRSHVTVIEAPDQVIQDFIMILNRRGRRFTLLEASRHGSVVRQKYDAAPYLPQFDRHRHPGAYYNQMYEFKVAKDVRQKHGTLRVTICVGDTSTRALSKLRRDGLRLASVDATYGFVRGSVRSANLRYLVRSMNVVRVEDFTWNFKGPFG